MLLAIDAGNTNVVFAVFDGDVMRAQFRATTKDGRTADELYVWLVQLMDLEGLKPQDLTDAIIATVVPQWLFELRRLCRKHLKCEPMVVGEPEIDPGIRIEYDRPSAVGADRIADAVAAFRDYGGPLIVIDFGTATTFNVITADGAYQGGVIAPGVNLSMEALHLGAAMLPRVAVARPQAVIGRDTVPAMQSGVYWGYLGLIEGLVARIKAEFGGPMKVIATGGLASLFRHSTPAIEHVDSDLTIRGLLYIWQRNAEAHRSHAPAAPS